MSSDLNIYQRIHNVMNEVETVGKNGRNEFHKYNYATEADFVQALRPLLRKHGLVVIPSLAAQPTITETGITTLAMKFTIVNIDKPDERVESVIPAQGQDKGDKGVYKALTGAKKYFAALTFMVATGDDPEKEDRKAATKETSAGSGLARPVGGAESTAAANAVTNGVSGRRPSFRRNAGANGASSETNRTASASGGDDI